MAKFIFSFFLVLSATLAPLRAEFFFKEGDSPIIFLGDSITEYRQYTTYLEAYILARFPTWKVTFRNTGWGGDTAWLTKRGKFDDGLQRDVLALQPKAITIDFGMNDARGGDASYPKYVEHMTKLAQKLKAAGAKVALLTPSPEEKFEPDAPAGSAYNRMLEKYSEGVKEVATKEQTAFVDQLHPFIKILEEAREKGLISKDGKDSLPRLMPDAIHPTMSGHLIMAWAILKGLEAPALVSEATLTASNVTDSKNCKIEMLSGSAGQIRFKRTDDAMPMPIWPESKLALTFPGLTVADDLNRYMLKVAGLSANEYELLIDNKSVGKFSKDTLEAGLNLSTLTIGPIYEQGKKLFETIAIKNTMYFIRWRQVQLYEPKELPEWLRKIDLTPARTAEMERLDNEITKYEAQIETYRKPVPHEFLLKPAA